MEVSGQPHTTAAYAAETNPDTHWIERVVDPTACPNVLKVLPPPGFELLIVQPLAYLAYYTDCAVRVPSVTVGSLCMCVKKKGIISHL